MESGSIALFLVEMDGGIEGQRHFLFRVESGEAVLAGASPAFARHHIVAVAVNRAELRSAFRPHLIDSAINLDREAIHCIQRWLETIEETLSVVHFQTSVELSAALADAEVRWLSRVESRLREKKDEEHLRIQKRQMLIQDVKADTLGGLAGILKSDEAVLPLTDGPPLLRAMQAVGHAQGIAIRQPVASENRTDPVQSIAQASGTRTRRVVLAGEWWKRDNGPLLGFLDEKQPVALLPVPGSTFSGNRYEIFNPAENKRLPVNQQTAGRLSPAALTFYRPLNDSVTSLDIFRFVMKGRGKDLLTVALAGIGATLLGMLVPQATSILVDQAIPDGNRSLVLQIGLGLVAAAAGSVLFELAQAASMLRIEVGSANVLQCGVWDRLLKLSPAFFRTYTAGDLSSRASAINSIRQQLSGATFRTLLMSFTSLLNLFLMFYYSPTLALVSLILIALVIVVTLSSGMVASRLTRPLQEVEGELFGLMVQLINGVSKLRIAAAEERAFAFWARLYARQQKLKQNIQKVQDRARLFNVILPALSTALIFWTVEEFLLDPARNPGGLALGTFLAFNTAFGTFVAGAATLSDTGIGVVSVKGLWRRARAILEAPPEVDTTKVHPGVLSGRISLEHVTFRYRKDGPLILDDVSVEVDAGECIALVGPSGSGKSTILNLLLHFEVPLSGGIYYDGHNLNGLDIAAVRRQLGVVLQDNKIMAGSIFDNIASGSLCTLEDAWSAAKAAAFDADIESMPMGMHTPISEGGGNLSGGQRQRLLIARALVLKPSILIFDEATSALDNRTQATVTESLRRLKVTTILVAHRLSTIRHAARIYVIDAGRVVQSGTFDELSRQDGLFARLIARQLM